MKTKTTPQDLFEQAHELFWCLIDRARALEADQGIDEESQRLRQVAARAEKRLNRRLLAI